MNVQKTASVLAMFGLLATGCAMEVSDDPGEDLEATPDDEALGTDSADLSSCIDGGGTTSYGIAAWGYCRSGGSVAPKRLVAYFRNRTGLHRAYGRCVYRQNDLSTVYIYNSVMSGKNYYVDSFMQSC